MARGRVDLSPANRTEPLPFKLKNAKIDKLILEFDWVRGHVFFTADSSRRLIRQGKFRAA